MVVLTCICIPRLHIPFQRTPRYERLAPPPSSLLASTPRGGVRCGAAQRVATDECDRNCDQRYTGVDTVHVEVKFWDLVSGGIHLHIYILYTTIYASYLYTVYHYIFLYIYICVIYIIYCILIQPMVNQPPLSFRG